MIAFKRVASQLLNYVVGNEVTLTSCGWVNTTCNCCVVEHLYKNYDGRCAEVQVSAQETTRTSECYAELRS